MALAAVWGTSGHPRALRPDQGATGEEGKKPKDAPKSLGLQSGALLGTPGHPTYCEDVPVLCSSNLRIEILIRSLAISGDLTVPSSKGLYSDVSVFDSSKTMFVTVC